MSIEDLDRLVQRFANRFLVVRQCALLECERQEGHMLAEARQVGREQMVGDASRAVPSPYYVCPACERAATREMTTAPVGAKLPRLAMFGCSAALMLHLLQCPKYSALIAAEGVREP